MRIIHRLNVTALLLAPMKHSFTFHTVLMLVPHAVELKLHRIPDSKLPLISRGLHWNNAYPFSR